MASAKSIKPVFQAPPLGFIRLERALLPDYVVEVRLPARANGVGEPTGGDPMSLFLTPGEPVGPMLWSDCEHVINNPPVSCIYAPVDKAASTDQEVKFVMFRRDDRLLADAKPGTGPDAWIRAYPGEVPPPPIGEMRSIGQTIKTRKAPGASFAPFETFSGWDTRDKILFAKLVRDGRTCVVTREAGSEESFDWKCDEKIAKVCFERVKKAFTHPPESIDAWQSPHIDTFWQALTAEDARLNKYRAGK